MLGLGSDEEEKLELLFVAMERGDEGDQEWPKVR